eukprot:g43620.t1
MRLGRPPRPVLAEKTGETYPSLTAAAHAMGVTPGALSLAIKKRHSCNGSKWCFIEDANSPFFKMLYG